MITLPIVAPTPPSRTPSSPSEPSAVAATRTTLLAVAYAFEQSGNRRKPPVLVDHGLLPITPARQARSAGRQ
jgi:hypothetical protein